MLPLFLRGGLLGTSTSDIPSLSSITYMTTVARRCSIQNDGRRRCRRRPSISLQAVSRLSAKATGCMASPPDSVVTTSGEFCHRYTLRCVHQTRHARLPGPRLGTSWCGASRWRPLAAYQPRPLAAYILHWIAFDSAETQIKHLHDKAAPARRRKMLYSK